MTLKEQDTSCDKVEDDIFGLNTDVTKNHSQHHPSECSYNDSFTTFMSEMKSLTVRSEVLRVLLRGIMELYDLLGNSSIRSKTIARCQHQKGILDNYKKAFVYVKRSQQKQFQY